MLHLFLLYQVACSQPAVWHHGTWTVDVEELNNTSTHTENNDLLALTLQLMRDIKFTLSDSELIIYFPNDKTEMYPYILIANSDGTIVIDIPNQQHPPDMQLDKDPTGVYFLAKEFEQMGSQPRQVKAIKIYMENISSN